MSTRTKSFFDQDPTTKSRNTQWHRPPIRHTLSETTTNTAVPKPPIPATAQSKAKLKSFEFVPNDATRRPHDERNKENISGVADDEVGSKNLLERSDYVSRHCSDEHVTVEKDAVSDDTRNLQPKPQFPSTPCARLPLEDLIGNFEGARQTEQLEQSPEEYIGWLPNSSAASHTSNQRKRKRARSSSPSCPYTSSQRRETSLGPIATPAQVDKIITEANPVADLWQQYGGRPLDDGELRLPDFSFLMRQASPKPLETPAKAAGFRRWASTGNDWPSCETKRRRTNNRRNLYSWQEDLIRESGGKSKVATMLEKIQQSLATQELANPHLKSKKDEGNPSSSSPLPETGAAKLAPTVPTGSPLEKKSTTTPGTGKLPADQSHGVNRDEHPVNPTEKPSQSSDLESRQTHDSAVVNIPAPLLLHNKQPLPPFKRPKVSRAPSGTGLQYPQRAAAPEPPFALQNPTQAASGLNEDFEEFGADLELSAEDLDELMVDKGPLHQPNFQDVSAHPYPTAHQTFDETGTAQSIPANLDDVDPCLKSSVNSDDGDEYGFDDIDEESFAQVEMNATQAYRISPHKRSPRKSTLHHYHSMNSERISINTPGSFARIQRYVIRDVVHGEYMDVKKARSSEKLLLTKATGSTRPLAISLRDSWRMTSIARGTVVHVVHLDLQSEEATSSNPPGQIIISDSDTSPLIIIHPDHMLSATAVGDSFDCLRKTVLQERVKATGNKTEDIIYGNIVHEIFQRALSANRWDDEYLVELVLKTVSNHAESLWEIGMRDSSLAGEQARAKTNELAAWAKTYVSSEPFETSLVDDKRGEKIWMSISKLIAIEEHIWSPCYGLKGKVDATVQSTVVDDPREPSKKLIMPVEVKAGNAKAIAHRVQTALYTLLLRDRYDVAVKSGILFYSKDSSISRIRPSALEMRGMVQQRNRLAAYIQQAKSHHTDDVENFPMLQTEEIEDSGLPTLLKNPFRCGKCYAQQSCFTYHALTENGSAKSAGMMDDGKKDYTRTWQAAVGHLCLESKDQQTAETLKKWFSKWDRLLTLEEEDISKLRREIWTMDSTEREAVGRCFGHLVIVQNTLTSVSNEGMNAIDGVEESGGKINRFTYSFAHADHTKALSFVEGTQLNIGEPIVVSSESGQWALANGYVIAASKKKITVAVDRKLEDARERLDGFDEERNQAFRGIMDVAGDDQSSTKPSSPTIYRLDKDMFSNGLAQVRNSLVTIMSTHPIQKKLRDKIILGHSPRFSSLPSISQLPPSQLGAMNEDQHAAVGKVLSADDYALILGMPGTGKTTTIAHLIRSLLAEEKTILLAAFTHTAVDNIILKIRDIAPPKSILRLGSTSKIDTQVQQFCHLASTPRSSIEEIDRVYMGAKIVATTCMGTNHALLNVRAFDVCIVDEASQITLPVVLGPLLHARKFVLVGDHYQLPPLVQNRAALEGGMDVSLFRQLSEQHPQSIASLRLQYRMCEEIMRLANSLIYDGQMRCGSDEVAQRKLQTPYFDALSTFHCIGDVCSSHLVDSRCWLGQLTAPEHKVVYANTDLSGNEADETLTSGKNITNELEATLSAQLVQSLLAIGVPAREIGVITFYRSQLALLKQFFKFSNISDEIDVDSADRFQGRDKECIIISMVRSNDSGTVGDLLRDWRRVNVAFTRARSKLIVLGSRRTLSKNELLARFICLTDTNGWSFDLPKSATSHHTFPFSSQTASDVPAYSTPAAAKKRTSKSPEKIVSSIHTSKYSSNQGSKTSPSRVLKSSPTAGNRGVVKTGQLPVKGRLPKKIIKGNTKMKSIEAELAFEIFEDLNADDL